MIKASFAFINFIGLFFFGFFAGDDIVIENNTPATLAPGEKQQVELVVTKGQVQGFSKLELVLPAGFSASPGDTKGASFTFSGQKAKFVWMTLPVEENFTVTYFIESAVNLEGAYTINGNFSYVKENKREDLNIPSKTVMVQPVLTPTPEQVASTMPGVKIEEMVVDMVCERTIEKVSDTEYNITLRVKNNAIKGMFGKILETVPSSCDTEAINEGGATITEQGNTIKFAWFETPDADEFECSYRIMCTTPTPSPVITGVFSYVMDGNPYDLPVIAVGGIPSEPTVRANVNTDPVKTPDTSPDTAAEIKPKNNTDTGSQTAVAQSEPKSYEKPVTKVPSPETGITYKVQIMAAHKVVNKSFMKKTYGFEAEYNIENHDGWVKYTTGGYTVYSDARDAREEVKTKHSKLPGPFVTAYSDGERITVQEALLISQQEWLK